MLKHEASSISADPVRRRLLVSLGLFLPGSAFAGTLLRETPRQAAGPFYPVELPLDDDNDLTRVAGRSEVASGQLTDLGGRLLDPSGNPLAGQRIEIWQCDANGRYRHPWDTGDKFPDANFQGHGHSFTDAEGRYRFRTIRPVPYPGRTPHIHLAVFPDDSDPFTTQLYVAGEPGNASDGLYRRLPEDQRALVTSEFLPRPGHESVLQASYDIVLGIAPAA